MSGPAEHQHSGVVDTDERGRRVHTFRQSTLGDLDECAERGRLILTDQLPRIETDAAAIGTACHAGIESFLGGQVGSLAEAIDVAIVEFSNIEALKNFEWKKYRPAQVRPIITAVMTEFADEILPYAEPVAMEIPFKGIVIHEDDERVIKINGTIDYFDATWGAIDWKTAGDERKYKGGFGGEGWKLDRWNIQATVYTLALVHMGMLPAEGPWDFTFIGFHVPSGSMQRYTVERTAGDHAWLARKCVAWAKLREADLDQWPLNDNHALCSPKWCPAWSLCKGASFEGESLPKWMTP